MIFVCINNSVATKNGNNDGTTEFAHRDRPDLTAGRFDLENNNKQKVKAKNNSAKKFLFNLIIYICGFNIINIPLKNNIWIKKISYANITIMLHFR